MARDDATFIRNLPFYGEIDTLYVSRRVSESAKSYLVFCNLCHVSMLTQVKSLGILVEIGFDSLNIIVMFVIFTEY